MGQGLTADKMKECVWVRPEVVAQIQFVEWTGADHPLLTYFHLSGSHFARVKSVGRNPEPRGIGKHL
jgi:hypothetical protein